jgi:glycosyltransferase involved in cell wall biosynthesis
MTTPSPGAGTGRARNVLYLHTTSEIGGSDVSLVELVERLDRERFRPIVALPSDGPLVSRLAAAGCEVLIVGRMRKLTTRRGRAFFLSFVCNYPFAIWRLARLVSARHVDLVHTNTIHNLYGIGLALVSRRPHVWHVREIVWQSGLVRRVERWLARFSDRVVVTSDAVGEMFAAQNGQFAANVRKIPNGVNLQTFTPGPVDVGVRAALGLPPDGRVVGVVCRLDAWKGVNVFLRAAAIVRAARPDVHFVIVGGAVEGQEAYARELEMLAVTQGLGEAVKFAGWRFGPRDMPSVYRALSLLVLPSRQPEPFGLVLLEAMATGLPVVATDQGGPREICVEGETGQLVPPDDPARLADAIGWMLDHADRARAMGESGRRRVESRYDICTTVRAIEAVYDELLPA